MLIRKPAMAAGPPMSLRLRVLVAIALVVALGAMSGGAFAGWLARQTLHDELTAAMTGGGQTVARALEALPGADAQGDLVRLTRTFDGNRHVIATLRSGDGAVVEVSRPPPATHPAPHWFAMLLDPGLTPARFAAPAGTSVVLAPAPQNDVADAWLQFGDALIVLGIVGAAAALLVYVTIGRALAPLRELTAAFGRVGSGDYAARVSETGPAELVRLTRSFNGMAADLEAMRHRTRVLEEQILKLEDEERAELARDLHDEIGPRLFAVSIDVAMLGQSLAGDDPREAGRLVQAIQASVTATQRQVRDILSRLRPAQLVELGLCAAIVELANFWRGRRPDIVFSVDLTVEDAGLPEVVQEAVYRIIQEALSNAVRHGQPSRIEISVRQDEAGGGVVAQVRDDGLGRAAPRNPPGFGLIGMRERIEAIGGALSAGPGSPRGWSVTASAPIAPLLASAEAAS
jgi:two-component system sensor histidine kinase UhpB